MATLRIALCALLVAGCYSPSIKECTIQCGSSNACPSEMTCAGDGYCHSDISVSCFALGFDGGGGKDGGAGTIDAPKPFDARLVDAPKGAPDAATPDGPRPDAAPPPCENSIGFVENSPEEAAIVSNLSIGPDGHEHITYIDDVGRTLRYAHRPPGVANWAFETVAPAIDNLKGQTIDSTGALHVVFSDRQIIARLRYARRSPEGVWKVETVNDTATSIDGTVAVDRNGRVHIAYWYNLSELDYATRARGATSWTYDIIDDSGIVGEHASIAVAPSGAVEVSYRIADIRNDLGFAVLEANNPQWHTSRPDTEGNVGAYTSLAIDGNGTAHVAYADNTNRTLRYLAQPTTGPRVFLTADATAGVGRFNSLALDGRGGVYISYWDIDRNSLKLAVKPPIAQGFSARTIDGEGDVGRHSSLVVDGNGVAHISYIDDTRHDLKYAVICP